MLSNALALASLLPLAASHFLLDYPTARGFNDDTATKFPCGGFDSVKTPRTSFPTSGGPIQLDMHHAQTDVAIYLSVGDDPGSNYSVVLRHTFSLEGLGDFCAGMVTIPASLNIPDGTSATIQVVSNGDPDGGLFQCADVTLTSTALSTSDYNSHCTNHTGMKVVTENISGNPNETTDATPSASGAAASSSSTALASMPTAASWMLGVAGIAGLVML
ncbi:hypothetical protein K504DRAFT_464223 [Pleomassaria siparia CBS 279.74]|uniref:Copper acquisition factor BIM1-like domain-containing protein n=1 Tax=Pleomassaria siparia CBS 279.74 TaxID=1314801 RepID=A0A6G1KH22_9PLEO|nr:hypothetical protein K504DRAFT_464223 [Pleomassaria siparia CBS 279.74]